LTWNKLFAQPAGVWRWIATGDTFSITADKAVLVAGPTYVALMKECHPSVTGLGAAPRAPQVFPPVAPVADDACCASCEQGGPCGGCGMPAGTICGDSVSSPGVPGRSAFPVGFGGRARGLGQASTATIAADTATGWGVPIVIAGIACVAGFGLAYVLVGGGSR
jgi:hypothetical protein